MLTQAANPKVRVWKWIAVAATAVLLAPPGLVVLEGRTRKGDKLVAEGRRAEQQGDWEKALGIYEQAVSEDPGDPSYRLLATRMRFQAAQARVDRGQRLREEGKLLEAVEELRRALAIDPSSVIARQELRELLEILDREEKARQRGEKPEEKAPQERGLSAAELARRELEAKLAAARSVPELKPLSPTPITLKMNNQPPRVLFETVGKLAGINVLFDPEFTTQVPGRPLNVELVNATLEEALDYIALISKAFWKPLSSNAVFVTADNPTKRQEYEDQVAKVFYLTNVATQQELTEIMSAIRAVTNAQRIFPLQTQMALLVRGTVDQVALAEMLLRNLDRPRPEVVVDIFVMEVNRSRTRDLTSGIPGLNIPIVFTPRNPVSRGGGGTPGSGSGGGSSNLISLSGLDKLSTGDWSLTLPGALLEALMSDRGTRVLQAPQVRTADGMKASLKIGDRVPYSTGGFQPAFGQIGTGLNTLFNTFQFLDVGVNVDLTPKVHGADEVSLHVELDISQVRDRVDIGGISQPLVGQRKVIHDIRLREGEVSLLGGLIQTQETKAISGVPGLASIPLLGRLFSSESVERNESELVVAIVPHVVRAPELDALSYKGIASGSERAVRVSFERRAPETAVPAAQPKPPEAQPRAPEAQPEAPAPAPAAAARVVLAPSPAEAQLPGVVTLAIQAENVTDLFDAPVRVKFDPNFLRLNEVQRGGFLSGDGREVIFTRNILNDTGDATIQLSRLPGTGGISGSGTLVTLVFQTVARGTTAVALPELAWRNSRGEIVWSGSPQVNVNIK
jgi:general secretion pathway protein D